MNKKLAISIFMSVFLIAAFTVSAQTSFIGEFEIYDDQQEGGKSTIEMITAKETIGGREVTTYTFKGTVAKGDYAYPYAGVTLKSNAATLAALKAGSGIRFKTTGNGRVSIEICLSDVTDWAYHNMQFNTARNEATVTAKYSDLKQASWGTKVEFNANNISTINLYIDAQRAFEFKIYDIEILPK
jgi:hypothetical protein